MATRPGSRERMYGYKTVPQSPGNKMENRPRSVNLYHTSRWTRESREFKKVHPLCEECKRQGKITAAAVTDHIIPYPVYKNFWDANNWQSLCHTCNIAKGNRDKALINDRMGQ